MTRNLLIIGIVLAMLSPLAYLLLQEYTYRVYAFTGYYQEREFDIAFEVPEFKFWETKLISEKPQKIDITYTLRRGELGLGLDDTIGPYTVRKADRTNPLTQNELDNMHSLKGGRVLYSTPVVEANGKFANMLIQTQELPGFYTLRAPVNFAAPCNLNDAKTVVTTIITTLAPLKNYQTSPQALATFNLMWNRGKLEKWPNQTQSCF